MRAPYDAPRPALLRWPLACVLFLGIALPAAAHRLSAPTGSTAGLAIPSVTHGQMVVLADHQAAILDLADRQYPPDRDLLWLRAYVRLQVFACVWGLVPGSLDSETSPFNECTHAHLAGTRALLLHLQAMPGDRAAANTLRRTIDAEMLANNAAMIRCQYSDEPFNTADVIFPHWSSLPGDGPASLTGAAVIAIASGGFICLRRTVRRGRNDAEGIAVDAS